MTGEMSAGNFLGSPSRTDRNCQQDGAAGSEVPLTPRFRPQRNMAFLTEAGSAIARNNAYRVSRYSYPRLPSMILNSAALLGNDVGDRDRRFMRLSQRHRRNRCCRCRHQRLVCTCGLAIGWLQLKGGPLDLEFDIGVRLRRSVLQRDATEPSRQPEHERLPLRCSPAGRVREIASQSMRSRRIPGISTA